MLCRPDRTLSETVAASTSGPGSRRHRGVSGEELSSGEHSHFESALNVFKISLKQHLLYRTIASIRGCTGAGMGQGTNRRDLKSHWLVKFVFAVILIAAVLAVIAYSNNQNSMRNAGAVLSSLWLALAFMVGAVSLAAFVLFRFSRWRESPRVPPRPGTQARASQQKAINLGYTPSTPETSFAPARWSFDPAVARKNQIKRITEYQNRLQTIRQNVLLASAPRRDPNKFLTDRQLIIQQMDDYCVELRSFVVKIEDETADNNLFVRAREITIVSENRFAEFCKSYAFKEGPQTDLSNARQETPSAESIETRFAHIFLIQSSADRERILQAIMSRKNCNRLQAMEFAVTDWEKDNRSWR